MRGPAHRIETALLRMDELTARLRDGMGRLLDAAREQRRYLVRAVTAANPRRRLQTVRLDHQRHAERLATLVAAELTARRTALASLAARLHALSPLAILERGYSLTRALPSLRVIRTAADVSPGNDVLITLGHGEIVATVRNTRDSGPFSGDL